MANESTVNAFQVCDQCRAKKIKCDREKPTCGNCLRSAQCCEWSGQGKKGNQITMLHTMSGIGSRLQQLEAAMLDMHRSLKRSRAESNSPSTAFSSRHDAGGEFPPAKSSATKLLFARPMGRFVEDRGCLLGTLYFGPTSLECLMLEFRDSISNQESKDIYDRIDSFVEVNKGQQQHLSGAALPTEPPLVILECMMEPYFSKINPTFPIWSRIGFQKIVASLRQQSICAEDEWASLVCCNNLILLNLTADSMHSVQRKMARDMTLDLIAEFLANSKRAIENLGILPPRLINLQALLSLCVVAQQHLPLHMLDFVFAQAIRCAAAIGVFHWHHLQDQLTESEFQDYKNIAHCLYIMDKQICWTAGVSPRVLKSEVQLDLTPSNEFSKSLAIKAELAAIEETIFLEVYAGNVNTRTEDEVLDVVMPINQRLDDWLVKLGVDVEATNRQPESCPVHAGLLFSSLCAKLLLIWPFKQHPDAFFQQHYSIVATCVRLLVRPWESGLGGGQHVSAPLLIASYPPLYLLGICSGILTGSFGDSELHSLRSFVKLLNSIVGSRQDLSYAKRLKEVSSMLVDASTASDAAAKRRKTPSSAEYLSRLSSSHHASREQNTPRQMARPNDDQSFVYTGGMGPDQQYIAASGFEFPDHAGLAEDHGVELFGYEAFMN